MKVTESGIVIEDSEEHLSNIEFLIDVIEPGSVIEVREESPSNALHPMDVTESGMVIEVRPKHMENAHSPIETTDPGIVTNVNVLQLKNAFSPMETTEDGIETFSNSEQLMNVRWGISVIESGMVTDSNFLHKPKALASMVFTVLGISQLPLFFGEHQTRRDISLWYKTSSTILMPWFSPLTTNFDKFGHWTNKSTPKDSTLAGIVIVANDLQLQNAWSWIVLTESGSVTEVSPSHPWNAFLQIVVTVSGME